MSQTFSIWLETRQQDDADSLPPSDRLMTVVGSFKNGVSRAALNNQLQDLDPEILTALLDELIRLGRLVRYDSDGESVYRLAGHAVDGGLGKG